MASRRPRLQVRPNVIGRPAPSRASATPQSKPPPDEDSSASAEPEKILVKPEKTDNPNAVISDTPPIKQRRLSGRKSETVVKSPERIAKTAESPLKIVKESENTDKNVVIKEKNGADKNVIIKENNGTDKNVVIKENNGADEKVVIKEINGADKKVVIKENNGAEEPAVKTELGVSVAPRRTKIKPQVQIKARRRPADTPVAAKADAPSVSAQPAIVDVEPQISVDVTDGALTKIQIVDITNDSFIKPTSEAPKTPLKQLSSAGDGQNVNIAEKHSRDEPGMPPLVTNNDVAALIDDKEPEQKGAAPLTPGLRRSRLSRPRPNLPDLTKTRIRHPSMSEPGGVPPSPAHHPPTASTPLNSPMMEPPHPGNPATPVHTEPNVPMATDSSKDTKDIKATTNATVPEKKKRTKPKRTTTLLGIPDTSKLTVRDLIHMNPLNNPTKAGLAEMEKKKKRKCAEMDNDDKEGEKENTAVNVVAADDPVPMVTEADKGAVVEVEVETEYGGAKEGDGEEGKEDKDAGGEEDPNMVVPQVRIGADGQIILNEQSLVLDQPRTIEGPADDSEVIVEGENFNTASYYHRQQRSRAWSHREMAKFYIALSMVGTDFSLMDTLFKDRTRHQLKRKFKSEEKRHPILIEESLVNRRSLDLKYFQEFDEDVEMMKEENKLAAEKKKIAKAGEVMRKREERKRKLEADRKLSETTGQDAIQRRTRKRKTRKKGSHYYENSESEEDAETVKKLCTDYSDEQPHKAHGDSDNDEEVEILTNMSQWQTKSGRQPKPRAKAMFASEAFEKKYTRKARDMPSKDGVRPVFVLPQNLQQVNSPGAASLLSPQGMMSPPAGMMSPRQLPTPGQFIPLSNLPDVQSPSPGGPKQLLFVSSKNPAGTAKGESSKLIHVYLISPPGTPGPATPGGSDGRGTPGVAPSTPRLQSPEPVAGTSRQAQLTSCSIPGTDQVATLPSVNSFIRGTRSQVSGEDGISSPQEHIQLDISRLAPQGVGSEQVVICKDESDPLYVVDYLPIMTQDIGAASAGKGGNNDEVVLIPDEDMPPSPMDEDDDCMYVMSPLPVAPRMDIQCTSHSVEGAAAGLLTPGGAAVPSQSPEGAVVSPHSQMDTVEGGEAPDIPKAESDEPVTSDVPICISPGGSSSPDRPRVTRSKMVVEDAIITTVKNEDGSIDLVIDPRFGFQDQDANEEGDFKIIDIEVHHPQT